VVGKRRERLKQPPQLENEYNPKVAPASRAEEPEGSISIHGPANHPTTDAISLRCHCSQTQTPHQGQKPVPTVFCQINYKDRRKEERKKSMPARSCKKKINEMDRQHINPLCLGCCKERIKRKERRRHGKFAIETRLKKVRPKKLSDRFTPTQEISKTIEVASD
jgi:hypothetical protein